MALFDTKKFTVPKAKPLPVILLLDTSGSMGIVVNPDQVRSTGRTGVVDGQHVTFVEGGRSRIDVLNEAVRTMLQTFVTEESQSTEFLVSVISFGEGRATLAHTPASATATVLRDLAPSGDTPLGKALMTAKDLIEDRDMTPSRAYTPLVILVSDGEPNDAWEGPLSSFVHDGRSSKCDRMALGIGEEAISGRGRGALERFVEGTNRAVFEASDADKIHEFFRFVTMSVVTRSQSQNPNVLTGPVDTPVPTRTEAPEIVPLPTPGAGYTAATVAEHNPPTLVTPWSSNNFPAPPTVPAAAAADKVQTAAMPVKPSSDSGPVPPPPQPTPVADRAPADDEDDYW